MLFVWILYGCGLLVALVALAAEFWKTQDWHWWRWGTPVAVVLIFGGVLFAIATGVHKADPVNRNHCRALGIEMHDYAARRGDAVAAQRLAEIAGGTEVAACLETPE